MAILSRSVLRSSSSGPVRQQPLPAANPHSAIDVHVGTRVVCRHVSEDVRVGLTSIG